MCCERVARLNKVNTSNWTAKDVVNFLISDDADTASPITPDSIMRECSMLGRNVMLETMNWPISISNDLPVLTG